MCIRDSHATAQLAQALRENAVDTLVNRFFPYHADVARALGLELIVYEGGTHVVGFGDWTENERLTAFYTNFNYSQDIADIYQLVLDGWHAAGGTLFNAFVEVHNPTRWGSWGHLRHLDDSNPRWDVLMDYNGNAPVTWETRAPGTFSHGSIRRAAPEGGRVEARHPRDVLLGGDGDDILMAIGCCVRIHGGAGRNVAIVPGTSADYAMQWDGNTLLATSDEGQIRMVNIQELQFSGAAGESLEITRGIQP
jgi:hypothetical protein